MYYFDPLYRDILREAANQGFTVPDFTTQRYQNALLFGLKKEGIWDKLDVFWLTCNNNNGDFSRVNWKAPTSYLATLVNSPTFANRGVSSNLTNSYVNLNWAPSNGVQYQQNAGSFVCGVYADYTGSASSKVSFGTEEGGSNVRRLYLFPRTTTALRTFAVNSPGATGVGITTAAGRYYGERTASTASELFRNNTSEMTSAQTSQAVSTRSVFLCALNTSATGANFYNDGIHQYVGFGGNFTSGERAAFDSLMSTYLANF